MESTVNRWMTSIVILAFFSIVALAGTRSVQASSNVVVTNSTTQPVPVAVQGTPGVLVKNAPLSPVPVNYVTHGKDGYEYFTTLFFSQPDTNASITYNGIPGERFVITNVSCNGSGGTHAPNSVELTLYTKANGTLVGDKVIPMSPYGTGFPTSADQQTLMYLDPTNKLYIVAGRASTGTSATCLVTLSGYRVTYP
jgi:hypothetical protein